MDRVASFAGSFYPAAADELDGLIDRFFQGIHQIQNDSQLLGLIVPHAGYVYSGSSAAYAYKHLQDRDIKRVFLIAPSHRGGQSPFSALSYDKLKTPLGDLQVDTKIVEALNQDRNFYFNAFYDKQEHSLEVQLPFIYKVLPKAQIIPIIFNQQTHDNALWLADVLEPFISEDLEHNLIIVSTDLSHYYQAEIAEKMDFQAIELIRQFDSQKFIEEVKKGAIEACGFGGIIFLMEMAKRLAFKKTTLLHYTHSGQVTHDNIQVVGYASLSFERMENDR
ncbi:MAG TPA: AmmeMemoRadiSam system protein B [Candidatus Cloacimonadota bacterium]|jgi:AmmeMemoRadiSam system protein B|nr:AmmeMemoRadiSam system protein B [Candidatus Cloacimonadales bacterium]HPY97309.1 AmmeMemoRadiSam system protein B [Candidatus Cloacimonadota bacterium]HQB41610.1 AmmeMemoRadiSam system protein B [Candidatus Cloacimonadota bacterium]